MVAFVNNSGVISAFDDSSSPAIETKWLKDNLRVEPYGDYLRLTSVSQNERKAVDYLVSEIVGATSANQIAGVLLGYLEDYGGGGGGAFVPLSREITIQGVTQDLSANRIFSFPSLPFKGGMYVEKIFTNAAIGVPDVIFIASVNKLYGVYTNSLVVFNPQTGEITNTLAITGIVSVNYLPIANQLYCFLANGNLQRVSVTATLGADALVGTAITGFGTNLANFPNRVLEISATKAYVTNSANSSQPISIINPTTLAVTSIAAVGNLQQCGFAYNTNGSSLQNGKVIVANLVGGGGIGVIDEATNTYNVTNNTFSSALSSTSGVKYIASQDRYLAVARLSFKLLILEPATSTTFTIVKTISGVYVTGDIEFDETAGLIFIAHLQGINTLLSIGVFDITTYEQIYNIPTNYQVNSAIVPKMSIDKPSRSIYVSGLQGLSQGSGIQKFIY